MSLALKHNVRMLGLRPQIIIAIMVANSIYEKRDLNCTITSVNDSKHASKSKHYIGDAVDFRVNNINDPQKVRDIFDEIKASLTSEYDVLLESEGTVNAHIHVEWDPRRD